MTAIGAITKSGLHLFLEERLVGASVSALPVSFGALFDTTEAVTA